MRKLSYLTLLLFFSNATLANTIFVNSTATGSNNGTSWANAYTDLQNAINNAIDGDEIWVAKGTYFPTRPADNLNTVDPNNRKNSFVLKNNVKLYGGFIGNESLLTQRNWNLNTTILSGDIGIPNNNSDNSYHVVIATFLTSSEKGYIDGFSIIKGNANPSENYLTINGQQLFHKSGGGILSWKGTVYLYNTIVNSNFAYGAGGGIYSYSNNNFYENIYISNNMANDVGGGFCLYKTEPVNNSIKNFTIAENISNRGAGGAIISSSLNQGNSTLEQGIIYKNKTLHISTNYSECYGTGLIITGSNNNTITSTTFYENESSDKNGGTIYLHSNFSNNINLMDIYDNICGGIFTTGSYNGGNHNWKNITLKNNQSYTNGTTFNCAGGLEIRNNSTVRNNYSISNLIVQGNIGFIGSGVNILNNDNCEFDNLLVTGNSASGSAPGFNSNSLNLKINSATIVSNFSQFYNSEYNLGTSNSTITNSIIGNLTSTGNHNISNSLIKIAPDPFVPFTGNNNLIGTDPQFVNALPPGLNSGGDYRLQCNSPCIDSGNNGYINPSLTIDLDNNNRIIGATTDMGAYEFNGTQAPALSSSALAYCQNEVASSLSATGTNLLWYTMPSGGIGSTTAPTPNTSITGTTTYYVTQTVAGCESPRAAISVEVKAPSSMPTVTPSVNYCQNQAASALSATGTTLLWYTTPNGGTGTTTAPIPDTSIAGTTTYYVTQNTNGCESARASINVIVDNATVAPSVTPQITYCQNETASALTASGTNLLWYSTPTGGTGSATAPIPNTSTSGTTNYYVTQTVGCESPRSAITVTVNPQPQSPVATSSLSYCLNETSNIVTATGTNLLWYTTPSGGTGSTIAPTPSTTTAGTTVYYVSQTIAGCESPRTAISVEVKAPSAMPTITPTVNYCQNQTASALSATGTTLLWYATPTGGIGSTTAPIPDTSIAGTTTYYVTQNTNGCESSRASINVIVDTAPSAPSVTPQITYCQNETASALTASGTNLLWYSTPTGGTGSTTAPIPNTSTSGTTNYYVTQTVGCESPRSAITVTVNPQPQSPVATSSLSYCLNETSNIVTATGTNLLWYTTPNSGTGSTTAPIPNTSIAGTTVYYVSQTIAGCESPRTAISVEVKAPSSMPSVTANINYCQNQTASALSATGTTLLWYTTPNGGTGTTIAPIPNTTIAGTTTYYVTQNTNGCESDRAAINVIVDTAPVAPSVTSQITYCQNETASALTASGTNLLWYSTPTGGTGSTTAPIPNTSTSGTTTYYVTQTVGCESQRSPIAVTIVPLPKPILAGGSICKDKNNVLVPFVINTYLDPATYSFQWYSIQSGIATIIPNATQNNLLVTLPGEYGVITKDRSTPLGCESEMSTTLVSLESEPIAIAVTQSEYFSQHTSIKVEVLPAGNYNYQLDNGAPQSNNVFTNVKPGEHIITVTNACGSITENVLLVDYPKFFTPNGDGFTETWNIKALQDQPDSRIEIFDRMGKLIKVIRPNGLGWDGTYNGKELPSTDYWFVVHYSDANAIPKTFKAHFTLKR